ncbi:MAG TPA: hypothetical protein VLI41_12480 [Phenylobacterium sp.]|uniref:hypothetical protein n=1 Tax=Phenylobacterium sp. TaxID=1871053 RepID=UPI002C4CF399|nr:hypothetical protein [Phenylobacterium sp.]HSV04011.1 hypothetical protein [Phenylobacterium sp.]
MRQTNARERLLVQEARAKARAEASQVAGGVAETVALQRGRGAAFEKPKPGRGGRETPYRRQAGLDWLARKGRISEAQKAAGLRYGEAFRIAQPMLSIGSTLEVQPGMGGAGLALKALIDLAGRRQQAQAKLAMYRRRLGDQPDLVQACDLVCGRELTPREAGGGERDGIRVEAVLRVALDLLAAA